jgi:hypothetical protein
MKQEGDVDPARNRAWVECLMRSPLKEFVAKVPSVAWAMCGHAIHAYYSSICHLKCWQLHRNTAQRGREHTFLAASRLSRPWTRTWPPVSVRPVDGIKPAPTRHRKELGDVGWLLHSTTDHGLTAAACKSNPTMAPLDLLKYMLPGCPGPEQ